MKRFLTKFSTLLLLISISMAGVSNAELHDVENAGGSFGASYLDLEIQDTDNLPLTVPLFDATKLKLGETTSKSFRLVRAGTPGIQYVPEFDKTGGVDEACDALELTAEVDGVEFYEGPLSSFNEDKRSLPMNGTYDDWEFTIVNNDQSVELQGQQCEFDLIFTAYQNSDLNGFSDSEKVTSTVGISYEASLTAKHNPDDHTFSFTLSKLNNFTAYTYSLDYDTDTITDHVEGDVILQNVTQKTEEVVLGTCSSTCTFHTNPHNFILSIGLIDIDGGTHIITEQL